MAQKNVVSWTRKEGVIHENEFKERIFAHVRLVADFGESPGGLLQGIDGCAR